MARIRCVKPDLWANEDLAEVGETAVLLALALENYADDEGYFSAHPKLLKAFAFPLRETSQPVTVALEELARVGWVRLLEGTDGRSYGYLPDFRLRQRIDRPTPSRIAPLLGVRPPDRDPASSPSASARRGLAEDSPGMEGGKGRKGKDGRNSPLARAARKGGVDEDTFSEFWATYPRRVKPEAARKAWAKIAPLDRPAVLEAARAFALAWAQAPEERRAAIPYPSSWINAGAWQDGPEEFARQARGLRPVVRPAPSPLVGAHVPPSAPEPASPRLEGLEPSSAEPWATIRKLARAKVDPRAFDELLSRLRQAPGANGTVRLVAPLAGVAELVRENHLALLREIAEETDPEHPLHIEVLAPEEYLAAKRGGLPTGPSIEATLEADAPEGAAP